MKKEKTQDASDMPQEVAIGGRIKKQISRAGIASEKATNAQPVVQSHMAAALQADQQASRTAEEYADSGLRTIDINNNDLNAFPPVGFALPIFELEESPSAWRSPTFVPEGGRT